MADTAAELTVDVTAKESVTAVLVRLESELQQSNSTAARLAQVLEAQLARSQSRAGGATLQHAQAQARLQAASGNVAGAIRTLQQGLDGVDRSSIAAVRAETQLVQLQTRLANELRGTNQFVEAFKQGLFGFAAPMALVNTGLSALSKAVDSFKEAFVFKAELDANTKAIELQLRGLRDSSQVFAEGQAFASRYKLTQEQLSASLQASIGVMRSSNSSTTDLLTNLSRLQVLAPEKPIEEAARALRELQSGDTTSIKELFNISAKDANKMKAEILGGADAVQVLGRFLDKAGIGMDSLAAKTTGAAGALKDLAIAQEELKLAQAQFAQGPGLAVLNTQINVLRGTTRLLNGDFQSMGQSLTAVVAAQQAFSIQQAATFVQTGDGTKSLTEGLIRMALVYGQVAGLIPPATEATAQHGQAAAAAAPALDQQAQALIAAANAADIHRAILLDDRQENIQAYQAALGFASAAGQSAVQSLIDADAKEGQAEQIRILQEQANTAVNSFLNLNPNIDQAGIASLIAAGKIDPLIGQLAQLRLEAAKTANQMIQLNSTLGGGIGASAKPLGRLDHGGGGLLDADAIGERIRNMDQTERIYAHFSGVETRHRARSRASGAAHLSDQQKLDNQLLAEQEKTQDKLEQAELDHRKRMLDIERDFQDKLRAQQRKNEIDKRENEASFLEKLTSSALNKSESGGQADLARVNAQYYADFEAAQKAAQEGQAALSEKLMDLAEKRADLELEYAERIDEARAKGDANEVARLEVLREKRRQILDEQQKQAVEDGDSIQQTRAEQERDEAAKYEEQTGKIADASDRAREQKVNNAVRSGKAVDDERLSVDRLTQSYERLGTVAGTRGAPASSTTSAPVPISSTPVDVSGKPLDAGAIVAALQQAQTAIVTALENVERAAEDTASAVRARKGYD